MIYTHPVNTMRDRNSYAHATSYGDSRIVGTSWLRATRCWSRSWRFCSIMST